MSQPYQWVSHINQSIISMSQSYQWVNHINESIISMCQSYQWVNHINEWMEWMSEWNEWVNGIIESWHTKQQMQSKGSWHARWMSHGTCVEWVMARALNESWPYAWVMTHNVIWWHTKSYAWVMAHKATNAISMSHGTHMNESWHTQSHIWAVLRRHDARYQWVMAHKATNAMSMSHGTQSNKCHINESWHTKQQMPSASMHQYIVMRQSWHTQSHIWAILRSHDTRYQWIMNESWHTMWHRCVDTLNAHREAQSRYI